MTRPQCDAQGPGPPLLLANLGLENAPGENNCFINVLMQALAHLPAFRVPFTDTRRRHLGCGQASLPCLFCALRALFAYLCQQPPPGPASPLGLEGASVGPAPLSLFSPKLRGPGRPSGSGFAEPTRSEERG
eukprot:RCo000286